MKKQDFKAICFVIWLLLFSIFLCPTIVWEIAHKSSYSSVWFMLWIVLILVWWFNKNNTL